MAGLTETATRNLKAELARHDKTPKDLAKAWGLEIRAVNNRLKGHATLDGRNRKSCGHARHGT